MDFREGNPGLSQGLENATAILSLICLVAMVLGAIGVAMAMHAHLEQRMDMLAILKAVGAASGDLLRIFLLQTLGLGLAGGSARRGRRRGRDGRAAGGLRQSAAGSGATRISLALGRGGAGNGPADHAALLSAAAAGRARCPAGAGPAQAGRAGAGGLRRLACALVGAPSATGNCRVGRRGAGRNRLGALGLGQGGRLVRSSIHALLWSSC